MLPKCLKWKSSYLVVALLSHIRLAGFCEIDSLSIHRQMCLKHFSWNEKRLLCQIVCECLEIECNPSGKALCLTIFQTTHLCLHHPPSTLTTEKVRYTVDNFLTGSYKPVSTLANVVLQVFLFRQQLTSFWISFRSIQKVLSASTYYRYISYSAVHPAFSCHTVAWRSFVCLYQQWAVAVCWLKSLSWTKCTALIKWSSSELPVVEGMLSAVSPNF